MLQAIIFDMDGVLVNSTSYNLDSFNKVLERYGVNIPEEGMERYLGRSLKDQIKMWRQDHNIKETIDVNEFSREALKYQLEMMEGVLNPDQYVHRLIDNAKIKDIKVAVATSSLHYRAKKMLEMIGVHSKLDAFVSCEDVSKQKPSPDLFLKAAEELGIKPDNCLVIEDAVNGIQAAKAAGMKAVAKLTKFHTSEDFKDADLVFSDFKELNLSNLMSLF